MAESFADYATDPAAFIDRFLRYNEQGKSWTLSPYQRRILALVLPFDDRRRLTLRLLLWSEPKKSGKTALAAALAIWWASTRGGDVTCLANDFDQAQGRVFATIVALLKWNGFEKAKLAKLLASEVRCTNGAVIRAVPSDYRGEAGGRQTLAIFDEPWGIDSERATRLFEEMTPIPTTPEAWILMVTTAGFTGESRLLEGLYQRGLAGERLDDEFELHRDGAFTMFWSHTPRQPWQTGPEGEAYYAEQRALLRPATYARLHRNEWVSSEGSFITAEMWDANVDPAAHPLLACDTPLCVGVDGGLKSDNLAVMGVTWDGAGLRLVCGRIWRPSPGEALDLERTVESYLRELHTRFALAVVRYDPWQLHRSMAALRAEGLPVEEYAQTEDHVGHMGQVLFDLLKGRNLMLYPDEELRQHALNAVAVEKPRGFAIRKERANRKVDGVVALAMACVAAVDRGPEHEFRLLGEGTSSHDEWLSRTAAEAPEPKPERDTQVQTGHRLAEYVSGLAARVMGGNRIAALGWRRPRESPAHVRRRRPGDSSAG